MNVAEVLSPNEIKELTKRSDLRGAIEILHTWTWIAFAFIIAGLYPSVITIALSLLILGGKQLACAIIMHDTSHYALFKSKKVNQVVGNWFGGFPMLVDLNRYRPYHIQHHSYTGSEKDPDLPLTSGYPAGYWSFSRKVLRDLTGLTGIKAFGGLMLMHAGILEFNLGGKAIKVEGVGIGSVLKRFGMNMAGPLAANVILALLLFLAGIGWTYWLWAVAYFTTYQLCLRIRSIAEHSVVPDPGNNHQNTRTTKANFFERLLFAPHFVNYHAEHHLLMTVPPYNLPKMHKLISSRGYFEAGVMERNYSSIVRLAVLGPTTGS